MKTTSFDVVDHLRTAEDIAAYLEACFEEAPDDAAIIAKALGNVCRARGMSEVARASGLSRDSLCTSLSGERSPDFDTVLRVIQALGLEFRVTASETLMQ